MKVQFLKEHRTADGVMHRIGQVVDIPDKDEVEALIRKGIAKEESEPVAPPEWSGGKKPDTGEAPPPEPTEQKKK